MKYFSTLPFKALLIAGALAATACSEDKIYIDCGCDPSQGGSASGRTSLMSFYASVESRYTTRAVSPIQQNVQAHIYAFDAAVAPASASGNPIDQGAYISLTPGYLTGVNGFKMNLPVGVYNFYGVSDNTSFRTPTFDQGVSEPLYNQTDYLWWSSQKQDVTSSQTSIPVLFFHKATQVVFDITAGDNIELSTLVLAHIYPPTEGAQMNLSTGVIPPATGYSAQINKMGVNGFTAQYIMLPIKTDVPLSVSFDIIVKGENTTRTFEAQVPLPDGELKAGNSYLFKAVINAETVALPTVNVAHWTEVDETGKPIYPNAE